MLTPKPVVRPLTAPPPLAFVIVWNGFVTVHAFFMLSGFHDKPLALAGLGLFYSLFFGAGYLMARAWWRVGSFQRRFGSPAVQSLTPVQPGHPFSVRLRFDRAWPPGQRLEGQLHWVVNSGKHLHSLESHPISSLIQTHPNGVEWHATATVPPPPAGELAGRARLELRLPDPAGGTAGWAVSLPLNAGTAPLPGLNGLQGRTFTPADREKLLKGLGFLSSGLLGGAVLMLGLMSLDRRLDFTDLIFPGLLAVGGWYARAFRQLLQEQRGHDLSKLDPSVLKPRFRGAGVIIPLIMVGAFAADILLPGDVFQTLRTVAGALDGVERPDAPPARFGESAAPVAGAGPASEETPLWDLLEAGDTDAARERLRGRLELLAAEQERTGFSPAHRVAYRGNIETLRMLLDEGLDVNAVNTGRDGRGETLLMAAARANRNSVTLIDLLLSRGARLHDLDRYGKNATDWAEFFGVAEASDELCRRGLEPTPLDPTPPNNEKRKRASCREPAGGR